MSQQEIPAETPQSYAVETTLQRACNSAVEKNMLDGYRADHVRRLNVQAAVRDFRSFVLADLPAKYRITITSVTGTASPPSLTAVGTVRFPTLFGQYGHSTVSYRFSVTSTNYTLT